jgi:hypothetical protein
VILDVDQLDIDAFLGEQALLRCDEERPVADPDEVRDPQRLGLGGAHGNQPNCRSKRTETQPNSHLFAS